jgi:hypothetical protein
MPGGDGAGPLSQNQVVSGRGRGAGMGRGAGFAGPQGECRCPNCGYQEIHQRGVPCNTTRCPQCNTLMIRT